MRAATVAEDNALRAFFDGLDQATRPALRGLEVGVIERDGICIAVLGTSEVWKLPPELLAGAEGALPVGTFETHGEDVRFHLDLQGAVLASGFTKAQTVRVTEHAARLFLYGRTILGDSVLWYDNDLDTGDACIVCNARGEAMGIGAVVGRFKGQREAVKAVHDLGSYLRDQDSD